MKNIFIKKPGRSSIAVLFTLGIFIFIVVSSFKNAPAACTGPFATGNTYGAAFAVFAPGTGAPNEAGTCGRPGSGPPCHNTVDNSGPGSFTLDIGGGATQYVPGQTYTVTVTISQTGISAFDFELTNRPPAGGSVPVGTFSITDLPGNIRTRLSNGNFGGAGTSYVEGNYCGVDQLSPGFNQWTFNWTAPSTGVGNITFYMGMVAANFNNAPTGDNTYKTTKVLTQATGAGISETKSMSILQLFPNPTSEKLSVTLNIEEATDLDIALYDLSGRKVAQLFSDHVVSGEFNKTFLKPVNLEKGIYLLKVNNKGKSYSEKLIME